MVCQSDERAGGEGYRIEAEEMAVIEMDNARYNKELDMQINGSLPAGHTYRLGNTGKILQAAGLPKLPIELQASRLADKSMQANHPFELAEVKGLPKAIQDPLAVFRSATRLGSFVIMTEIKHNDKNYVVAVEANKNIDKLKVNSIRSVYPRDGWQIVNWVNENLLEYAEKEKMTEWLSKQQFNSADVRKALGLAKNIVNNFQLYTLN